jgi:hypothetical protein
MLKLMSKMDQTVTSLS